MEWKNALDALVNAYTSISTLRQQSKPTIRVAGIIKKGGTVANIIPDDASAEYSLRATNKADLDDLRQKITTCFQAGAGAARCTVEYTTPLYSTGFRDRLNPYLDLRADSALCARFTAETLALGYKTVNELAGLSDDPGASTDQALTDVFPLPGNVFYVCPAIMPAFSLEITAFNHTAAFQPAAGTLDAFERAVKCGEGLACLAFPVFSDDNLAKSAKENWKGMLHKTILNGGEKPPALSDELELKRISWWKALDTPVGNEEQEKSVIKRLLQEQIPPLGNHGI
ncbi:hypothetical protein M422DRAFT_48000 [Sphaerobolus stellatus SS14]|uniref:Peptidase M20 dimerisation domain-containing protein n=1 Tax=Sphaerobolus stellatus (strain SS14) TaxID=990650 RepID=A0A0C9V820_SPHS4|nr:hypothetical protein M422DRAFT_48000 [Sphaerobolus stellatus SS14]